MKHKTTVALVLSGVFWGILCVFVKGLTNGGLDPMQIVFIRMLVATPVFIAYAIIRRRSLRIKIKDLWMFIGIGILSEIVFNCFYFYTVVNSEASTAVVLLYTAPAFVMILSAVFFKEKLNIKKISALIMTMAGCFLVSGFIGSSHAISVKVLITGVCSGFFFSLFTIFSRVAIKKYKTEAITSYSFFIALMGSLFIGKPVQTVKTVVSDPWMLLLAIGIGVLCTALPCFLYTWGLRKTESGKAAILAAVEPIVGAVIGMTVYDESRDPLKIFGIILIVTAIIILEVHKKRHKKLKSQ